MKSMKIKITLIALVLTTTTLFCQSKKVSLGIATGFLNSNAVVKFDDTKTSNSEIDFYVGLSGEFTMNDKLKLQTQLLYFNKSENLVVPLLAKFKASEKFSFLLGPQLFFNLNKTPNDFSEVNINGMAGFSYDLDANFNIQTTYSYQINNSYTGDADLRARVNYFNIGYIFKF